MENLKAVKILHTAQNRVLYDVIAEYVRFAGVFVWEDIIDHTLDGNGVSGAEDAQLLLYLTQEELRPEIRSRKNVFQINPQDEDWKNLTFENWTSKGRELRSLLVKVTRRLREQEIVLPVTHCAQLLSVYIKNNTAKAAANLQYYRLNTTVHEETERIFQKTYDQLSALESAGDPIKDTLLFQYASLYSRQKINQACYFQNDRGLKYRVYDLVEECRALIKKHPEEANLHVLLGLITEKSYDGYNTAVSAYNAAVKLIGDQPYASHIYYWMGLLHERSKGDLDKAKYAYVKAYALQRKYRNIYKVAVMFETEKKYDRMMEYFKKCLDSLNVYLVNEIDPLEMEYYYKVCALLCIKYMDYYNDPQNTILYGEKAHAFLKEKVGEIENFKRIYGDEEALQYQDVSIHRINPKRVYEKLALAYRDLGDTDKSEEYRNMF